MERWMCGPNVSPSQPEGSDWEPHPGDVSFQSLSVSVDGKKVWSVGEDGNVYLFSRQYGLWIQFRSIEAGISTALWAIDNEMRLYLRRDINDIPPVCPENVKSISVSVQGELWGILESVKLGGQIIYDVMARRVGITSSLPQGTAWNTLLG
ncbi:Tectonin betapropeller repeatcontaining proteinlike [Caligus rogercresseyi]|uniref:Tectonin betapropeller repeatcontaining proteinlike n=1 Tax=Caligus rogercresseyi TaxID=217165 RepID=A0A7T8KE12_CALRO|nr:Tectonin betapropeller repeatcontaining proteinlike [Caligus rogercresseyi]